MLDSEIPERYENHPLFVILENYILHTIGYLDEEKAALLGQTIATIWGGPPAQWKKTTRQTLDLPDTTDADLKKLWKQKQEEAAETQTTMTPEDFARKVVDENYADLNAEM